MMTYNYAAVIINFNNFSVTVDCVNSILFDDPDCAIIIVDNNSSNDSVDVLSSTFSRYENVYVLKSYRNEGYSGGCNMGIDYARNKLNVSFVAVLNSDLIFNGTYSFKKMYEFSLENEYGLINIKLHNKDCSVQTPYGRFSNSIFYEFVRLYGYILINFMKNLFKKHRPKNTANNKDYKYIINGPAFCLTKLFFEKYNYLFEKNFMYNEEFNLFIYLKKAKLRTVTFDCGETIHLEGESDKQCKKNSNKKLKQVLKSSFKSFCLIFKSQKRIKNKYRSIKGNYDIYKKIDGEE